MPRPQGEIRHALGQAATALAKEQGSATWRAMAERACVGFDAARRTVENMARAGELQPAGEERTPHSRRPMVRYAPGCGAGNWATATTGELARVVTSWRS